VAQMLATSTCRLNKEIDVKDTVIIYFYKNILGQNKYLGTASVSGAQSINSLFGLDVLDMKKKAPKWNLGTYLTIDGLIFKI
jgi:hypothetical protein